MTPEFHHQEQVALIITEIFLASVFLGGYILSAIVRRGQCSHIAPADRMALKSFGLFGFGIQLFSASGIIYLLLQVSASPFYVHPSHSGENFILGLLVGGFMGLLLSTVVGGLRLYQSVKFDVLERKSWRELLSDQ